MINVLIAHDREEVVVNIRRVLDALGDDIEDVVVCSDTRTTRDKLRDHHFDLMISDLTMPYIKGRDQPSFSNVQSLLEEVFEGGVLDAPGDLIGISREAEALQLVKTDLGSHFMVTITEANENSWMTQLRDRISYTIHSAASRQMSLAKHFDRDLLLVTAMDAEFEPYRSLFELKENKIFPGVYDFSFNDASGSVRNGVVYSVGKSGQPTAASRTQSLISWFRPKVALMSGYCGGLEGKTNLGDLCFFESSAAWDYGKWDEIKNKDETVKQVFRSRPNPLSVTDTGLINSVRQFASEQGNFSGEDLRNLYKLSPVGAFDIKVRLTHAASGSAVVANDMIVDQISGLNDSIRAVDMESYGFYDACINTFMSRPRYLCIKSVSDFCNGEKGDDYHDVCSLMSALAVKNLITSKVSF